MRSVLRTLVLSVAGISLVLAMAGCGGDNESSMAATKGVAPPNAPKTQADFYKQQQELKKEGTPKTPPQKSN